ADEVLARDLDVAEADDAVPERLEPHEAAAVLDLDARPAGLDDEAADLLGRGVARHDDEQLRERPVRAPELLAVQHPEVAAALGGGGEARRIGADVRLGERERRDRARGAAR